MEQLAALLLSILQGLFPVGPVSRNLRDLTPNSCGAVSAEVSVQMVVASSARHHVPPEVLLGICLIESGMRPCGAIYCGAGGPAVRWACAHGADCAERSDESPGYRARRLQIEAAAVVLAHEAEVTPGPSWALAAHGYHLGGHPRTLRSCPAWHHHPIPYGLMVMRIAHALQWRRGGDTLHHTDGSFLARLQDYYRRPL